MKGFYLQCGMASMWRGLAYYASWFFGPPLFSPRSHRHIAFVPFPLRSSSLTLKKFYLCSWVATIPFPVVPAFLKFSALPRLAHCLILIQYLGVGEFRELSPPAYTLSQIKLSRYTINRRSIYHVFGFFHASRRFRKVASSPPGPPGLPFLGSVSLLWERKPWLRFTEWKDVYGPVVQLRIFGKTIVVLNTHEAAVDLLCRRGRDYDGRPRSILISELMTGGLAFPLIHGDLWKRHRRAAQSVLNPRAVEQYHGNQERHSKQLVQDLLQAPEEWPEHVKRSLYSLYCSVGYGDANKDRASYRIRNFIGRIVHAAIPGSSATDFFPVLARLPSWLSPPKRHYLAQFRADNREFVGMVSSLGSDVTTGDSMVTSLLGTNEMSTSECAWLIAVLCAIGGEVTSSVLPTFLLAMALYPDVQRRAQSEVDSIVGKDRFPTFEDRHKLPYVQAIVREVLRWRPIGPIGFPRCCLQDNYYGGHLIEAGSIVVPNIWAMNRDPLLYPDYDEFRPERFLNFEHDVPGALGQGHVSYGFGDRICSGMHIANDALFINIAVILQACDITKRLHFPLTKDVFEDFGIVTRPGIFPCQITARNNDV